MKPPSILAAALVLMQSQFSFAGTPIRVFHFNRASVTVTDESENPGTTSFNSSNCGGTPLPLTDRITIFDTPGDDSGDFFDLVPKSTDECKRVANDMELIRRGVLDWVELTVDMGSLKIISIVDTRSNE